MFNFEQRRWRSLAALVLAAAGLGLAPVASAQTQAPSCDDPEFVEHSCAASQQSESTSTQSSTVVTTMSTNINNQRRITREGQKGAPVALNGVVFGGAAGADDGMVNVGRLSVFFNDDYSEIERDATAGSAAFDQDSNTATLGADYRLDDSTYVGASLAYTSADAELDFNAGSTDISGYVFGVHGARYMGNLFVNGLLTYGMLELDIERFDGDSSYEADPDAEQWSAEVSVGYEYSQGRWRVTPIARALYLSGEVDSYSESVKAAGFFPAPQSINSQEFDVQTLDLSVQADYIMLLNWGVLIPSLKLAYQREFADATTTKGSISGFAFVKEGDDPNENTATATAGVAAQFKRGLSAFASYEYLLAHGFMDRYIATIGVRYELP